MKKITILTVLISLSFLGFGQIKQVETPQPIIRNVIQPVPEPYKIAENKVNWDSVYTVFKADSIKEYKKNPCSLKRDFDEFNSEVSYRIEDEGGEVTFIKVIRNNVAEYYLQIYIQESGPYNGVGVVLILENGQKINKPTAKVEYTYMSGEFYSKTFLKLNANDIALLKDSGIKKYKLYVSKGETAFSKETCRLFNCLLKVK